MVVVSVFGTYLFPFFSLCSEHITQSPVTVFDIADVVDFIFILFHFFHYIIENKVEVLRELDANIFIKHLKVILAACSGHHAVKMKGSKASISLVFTKMVFFFFTGYSYILIKPFFFLLVKETLLNVFRTLSKYISSAMVLRLYMIKS